MFKLCEPLENVLIALVHLIKSVSIRHFTLGILFDYFERRARSLVEVAVMCPGRIAHEPCPFYKFTQQYPPHLCSARALP